jgi:hypothetical protein
MVLKLQEKLGQIMYNKFHDANCSHGYEVPIWISFHIRSADKFKNDRQVPAGRPLHSAPDRPLFDRPRYFKLVPENHFSRDDNTIFEVTAGTVRLLY